MPNFLLFLKTFFFKFLAVIIIIGLILFLVIFFILGNKKIKQNDINQSCNSRIQLCLKSYNDFPYYPQKPIPEFYNNQSYNDPTFPHALRDYFYACSYKSYLPCGYSDDVVSYNALGKIIEKGARVIHLDMFYDGFDAFDKKTKVVVGNVIRKNINNQPVKMLQKLENCNNFYIKNGKCSNKKDCFLPYLEFINCLKLIRDTAWKNTNAPLFLYLNLEFEPNQGLEYQIFSQIFNLMPAKLLDKYYGFQRVNVGAIPFVKAKNKLIIITNRKPLNSFLDELTNSVMSPESIGIKLYKINVSDEYKETGYFGTNAVISQMSTDKSKNVENTSQNMVAVIKETNYNTDNIYTSKIDIFNYDTEWNFNNGISMTFMNWQVYPDINNYMKNYMDKFKNGGMILKSPELRYVPRQPEPEYQRNKILDYDNIKVKGLNGFMNFQT